MKVSRAFFAALFVLTIATAALADEAGMKRDAQEAGVQWLNTIDAAKYAESYDMAAPMFKVAVTKPDWERAMNAARAPLGTNNSRQLASATYATSLPGAPDGKYVVMQFNSVFQNKKAAVETLTMILGDDGKWRPTGYFIK